jgi:hypothetical protein
MDSEPTIRLIRHARYQRLRTAALRLLFITTPCAVLGGLWYWLSPGSFAAILLPWSVVTGVLAVVLVVVELLKWPLHKYEVVYRSGGADEVLFKSKQVSEARAFLSEYVKSHGIDDSRVSDVTSGRRG